MKGKLFLTQSLLRFAKKWKDCKDNFLLCLNFLLFLERTLIKSLEDFFNSFDVFSGFRPQDFFLPRSS